MYSWWIFSVRTGIILVWWNLKSCVRCAVDPRACVALNYEGGVQVAVASSMSFPIAGWGAVWRMSCHVGTQQARGLKRKAAQPTQQDTTNNMTKNSTYLVPGTKCSTSITPKKDAARPKLFIFAPTTLLLLLSFCTAVPGTCTSSVLFYWWSAFAFFISIARQE